jgi:Sulfotransferase domain
VLPPTGRSLAHMSGLVKAADRRLARHLSPGARRRLAAVAGGRVLGWYRRRRSDAVLVSFPKCGRTWLRVMVGRAFQLHFGLPDHTDLTELAHLAEIDRRVPLVLVTHDDDAQYKAPAEVERDKSRYRQRRVVLLVRDPRDVIVSLYHQMHGRRDRYEGTLAEFVDEPVGGFASLLAFYDAWAAALDVPTALLVVRYEDLHTRPEAELAQVLAFLGVAAAPATVAAAVAHGSFANMRRLEESGTTASDRLRPGRAGDLDTYKTRKGMVGGFRDELDPDQIARLDRMMAASSALVFGYGS